MVAGGPAKSPESALSGPITHLSWRVGSIRSQIIAGLEGFRKRCLPDRDTVEDMGDIEFGQG